MKLFKRTSIFLLIFIALVWTAIIAFIKYPENNIRVTDVEIKQTMMLLEKTNTKVPDKLLKRSVHAIYGAKAEKRFKSVDEAAEKIVGSGAAKSSDGTYISGNISMREDNGSITVSGMLDGYTDKNSALSRAKKLVSAFGMSYDKMEAHVYDKSDDVIISLIPQFKGRNVFDCAIDITIAGNGAYKLKAKPMNFVKSKKMLVKSPCSALAELAGEDAANGLEIENMILGYKTKDGVLIPVWEFVASDGGLYYIE